MSEEEQKAIEVLKKLPITLAITHLGGGEEIQVVLNLIENQQEEINKYKESTNYNWNQYQDIGKKYFALIEKIKNRIKELNECRIDPLYGDNILLRIKELQELLEEE